MSLLKKIGLGLVVVLLVLQAFRPEKNISDDHSKNIAEFIIYIVKGEDVRHTPLADIEAAMNTSN